ncbi:MAG: AbrB/MazE/SpoVT family DNA-binding domain-containing protein [Promethearchaeota archaeon]
METKVMRVNSKGMVTIPVELRNKYDIHEGSEVAIIEVNGEMQILPILDLNEIRSLLPTRAEMKKIYLEAHDAELELENK